MSIWASKMQPVEGYSIHEYLSCTGAAYIDTKYKPTQLSGVEVKFQSTQTDHATIFGCDSSWVVDDFSAFTHYAAFGTQNGPFTFYSSNAVTVKMDKNKVYQDGTLKQTFTNNSFTAKYNLYIMALNRSGTAQEYLSGKVYYCKIWNNGTLVHDMVPAMRSKDKTIGFYDKITQSFYESTGSGLTCGPQNGSIGDSTKTELVTQEIKKMFVGVDGIRKKVRKAYVGVNGANHRFWGSGVLTKYGTADGLNGGGGCAGISLDNYAMFHAGTGGYKAKTAYDKSLTKINFTSSSDAVGTDSPFGLRVGDYALITYCGSYNSPTVAVYDQYLTARSGISAKTNGRYPSGACANQNGVLAGETSYFDLYTPTLTHITASPNKASKALMGACGVGGYAVFVGGYSYGSYGIVKYVQAVNDSGTVANLGDLDSANHCLSGHKAGEYAVFAGGRSSTSSGGELKVAYAFDTSLTRRTIDSLTKKTNTFTVGGSFDDKAIFSGGMIPTSKYSANVDIYDDSLVHTIGESLSLARHSAVGARVGDYFLVAGGNNGNNQTVVDVYISK